MRNSFGASRARLFKLLIVAVMATVSLHATPAFADDTKKLFGFVEWFNGKFEKLCNMVHPGSPVKAPVKEAPKPAPPPKPEIPEETFKSNAELSKYLECYSTEKGRYDKIKNEYMPLIETAAKEFEIPKTLLACLIMRESRFDVNARSKTGAIGLGQHLQSTMKYLTQLLKPMDAATLQRSTDDIMTSAEDLVKKKGMSLEQANKDRALAKTRLTNRLHTMGWESYFAALEKKKLHKGATPRVISAATVKDPQVAIGATAMYLKMILYDFRDGLDSDLQVSNSDKQNPNYHTLLAAAGAYNMGPGAAVKILAPIEPPDRAKWVDALAHSNEETAKHILSIQRCIESSASKRGNAFLGPIGTATYNCDGANASADPRIVTQAFNDLPEEYKNKFKTASMNAAKNNPNSSKKTAKGAKAAKTTKAAAEKAAKASATSAAKKKKKKGDE